MKYIIKLKISIILSIVLFANTFSVSASSSLDDENNIYTGINILPISQSIFIGDDNLDWENTKNSKIEKYDGISFEGDKSLRIFERIDSSAGTNINLKGNILKGVYYKLSFYVYISDEDTDLIQDLIVDFRSFYEGNLTDTEIIAHERLKPGEWKKIQTGFITDSFSSNLENTNIIISGPQQGVDFYIDRIVVQKYDWKMAAQINTEKYRKSDVIISVSDRNGDKVPDVDIKVRQIENEFGFGSAINNGALQKTEEYGNNFKMLFNYATFENEAKWTRNEPEKGVYNYADLDNLILFCEKNNIRMRGHTVFWENHVPQWVRNLSEDELKIAMESRIDGIMSRYKGRFDHWDVINEMVHLSFFNRNLGDSIWTWMLQRAKEIDPAGSLFINDFNIVSGNSTERYVTLIEKMLNDGAPVEGIGVQGHFPANRRIDPVSVSSKFEKLHKFNLPIWVTEFDAPAINEKLRADNLEILYRTAFADKNTEGIVMWGFWFGAHWRGPDSTILNYDWSYNEAGEMYINLRDEWSTKFDGQTDDDGKLLFRGFHGDYELEITWPNGNVENKYFTLSSDESIKEIDIVIKTSRKGFFKWISEFFSNLFK